MKNFNLTALTDEQCQEFVALLNRDLFDHLGFYKNAKFVGKKQNDHSSVYLVLQVDGYREKEHYVNLEQIEIKMALLLNEFDCLRVSTKPVLDVRNGLLKNHISEIWRKFLSAKFQNEYEALLAEHNERKSQGQLAQ